ncbi:hypothetical protein ZIOFF_008371 [Zingiber officinale]|uniref:Nucleotide-binding protein-like n=1 Tax=Zingiber officinale TaxID=94328 RepID=A0A8J5II52_ZINOF|nr:hypothetical protein ZIOFF_008371 [Zingiber officinale]
MTISSGTNRLTSAKCWLRLMCWSGFKPYSTNATKGSIDGIKDIVAVASGKGGVGKSTTAVDDVQTPSMNGSIYGLSESSMVTEVGIKELWSRDTMPDFCLARAGVVENRKTCRDKLYSHLNSLLKSTNCMQTFTVSTLQLFQDVMKLRFEFLPMPNSIPAALPSSHKWYPVHIFPFDAMSGLVLAAPLLMFILRNNEELPLIFTFTVNLAVVLANTFQLKVGLLDADIYGPSIPTMMNLQGKPEVRTATKHVFADMKMIPIENHKVRCMSIGFLVEKDAPIVWRGPMVMSALEKMTRGVAWGDLDLLIVDMPPGTGDAQLSISQRLQLSGALIISTPQDIALIDARRGANMFRKVEVPILGLVENMSCFKCPHCGEKSYIFGNGGTQRTAKELDMKYLGEIPLEQDIRSSSDDGLPIVLAAPHSQAAKAYTDVAEKMTKRLQELAVERQLGPQILL